MNVEMLKFIEDMFTNHPAFDEKRFYAKFPKDSPATSKDLKTLEKLGYINIVDASGKIFDLTVSQKAIDYFS